MYLVTAKVAAWEEDFPGSRVEWKIGQSREVHDSLVEKFKRNPSAWTVSGGNDSNPIQVNKTFTGGSEYFIGGESALSSLVFGIKSNAASAAESNTNLIQAAIDRGGKVVIPVGTGTVYHSSRLVIGDDADIDFQGAQLKRTSESFPNSIVTKAYVDAPASVTVSWSSGRTATIGWAAHGKNVGDYVSISGAPIGTGTPSVFQGIFRIASVVDANNLTITLYRKPRASPTGTWFARSPTNNFKIRNLVLEFNTESSASNMGTHAIILAHAMNFKVECPAFANVLKYCIFAYSVYGGRIENVYAETLSDGVHIFGPARNVVVDGISGKFSDDLMAVSSRDLTGNWVDVSGGDIVGVRGFNLSGSSTTALAQVYSHVGYLIDDLEYANVTGDCLNSAVNIFGDQTDGGSITKLTLSGISSPAPINITTYGGGAAATTIQSLVIKDSPLQTNTDTSQAITFGAYAVVKKLLIENCVSDDGYGTSASGVLFLMNGTVENITVRGGRYVFGANGRLIGWSGTTAGTKKIVIDDVVQEGGNTVVNKGATVTDVPQIVLSNSRFKGVYDVVALSSNADVVRNGCTFDGITGAVVHVYNAAATAVNDWETGCQYPSTADAKRVVCSAGTYNPKSLDIRVDVGATGVAKAAGNLAFNIGSGRGTLVQNRHVTCNGTNYVQVDTPANVF